MFEEETGTTIGLLRVAGGFLAYRDSRRTYTCKDTQKQRSVDTADKFHVISQRHSMYFLNVGNVRRCRHLVENIKSHVTSLDKGSKEVSLKGVADFSYDFLKTYDENSNEEYTFGGIIIGKQPSKEFDAYGVGLCAIPGSKIPSWKHFKSLPFMVAGSGTRYARPNLKISCVKPNICKTEGLSITFVLINVCKPNICNPNTYFLTQLYDSHTGGLVHVYEFENGKEFNLETMHTKLDPVSLHLEHLGAYSENERLLLLAIERPTTAVERDFEHHLTTLKEVYNASRFVGKGGYSFYRVLCTVSADDAFAKMMSGRAPTRDANLPLDFLRVRYIINGEELLVNVARLSRNLLEYIHQLKYDP